MKFFGAVSKLKVESLILTFQNTVNGSLDKTIYLAFVSILLAQGYLIKCFSDPLLLHNLNIIL